MRYFFRIEVRSPERYEGHIYIISFTILFKLYTQFEHNKMKRIHF